MEDRQNQVSHFLICIMGKRTETAREKLRREGKKVTPKRRKEILDSISEAVARNEMSREDVDVLPPLPEITEEETQELTEVDETQDLTTPATSNKRDRSQSAISPPESKRQKGTELTRALDMTRS